MTSYNGKLADPHWRQERARKAQQASRTPQALIRALDKVKEQITDEDLDALIRIVDDLEDAARA